MKPYQPSNKVPAAGFQWLLLSSILGGLAIGGLTFAISQFIYLVLIFPVAMGLAGGVVSSFAIRQGKVRNPSVAAVFGALTGLILYGTAHGGEYIRFKQVTSQEINASIGQNSMISTERIIDDYLQQETGSTGFVGYLKYSAKQGVTIGEVGRDGFSLNETFTWVYWLIEFAIIEGIIFALAYGASKNPFCENCENWYSPAKRLGNVSNQVSNNFVELLNNDNFSRAGELLEPLSATSTPSLEVQLQSCPACKTGDCVLTIHQASLDSNGKLALSQLMQGVLSASQTSKFLKSKYEILLQQGEVNPEVEPENLLVLAQAERSFVDLSDSFKPHNFDKSVVAKLVEQISQYRPIKEAYLVEKVVQFFPENPLYILGIIRKKAWIESEIAEQKFVSKLTTELEFPGSLKIISLTQDKALVKVLQEVAGAEIYRRSK